MPWQPTIFCVCGCSGYTWSDDKVFQQLAAGIDQSRAVGVRVSAILCCLAVPAV
jgi:hypothetical protein